MYGFTFNDCFGQVMKLIHVLFTKSDLPSAQRLPKKVYYLLLITNYLNASQVLD